MKDFNFTEDMPILICGWLIGLTLFLAWMLFYLSQHVEILIWAYRKEAFAEFIGMIVIAIITTITMVKLIRKLRHAGTGGKP